MKSRAIVPAMLAVGLLYLAAASNAHAFELLDRVLNFNSGHGCGCEAACGCEDHGPKCGCEPACGCEPKGRRGLFKSRGCGCEPACGCEPEPACGCEPSCKPRRSWFGKKRDCCEPKCVIPVCHCEAKCVVSEPQCGCEPTCKPRRCRRPLFGKKRGCCEQDCCEPACGCEPKCG